jgi:hypothetical protein
MKGGAPADIQSAMVESAGWRLLGLLFERPRPGLRGEIEVLARRVSDPKLKETALASRSSDEGSYLRILGPGGPVSPREVAYRPRHDSGALLSELAGFYETHSYRPAAARDPADHVAVEVGFLGFMSQREAFAVARGDDRAAESTRRTKRAFMEEHLGVLSTQLAERLERASAGHLVEAARVLRNWCRPRARRGAAPVSIGDRPG